MSEIDKDFAELIAKEFSVSRRWLMKPAPHEDWSLMNSLPPPPVDRVTPWLTESRETEHRVSSTIMGKLALYGTMGVGAIQIASTAIIPPLMNIPMALQNLTQQFRNGLGRG
jgi:hypothetical protein